MSYCISTCYSARQGMNSLIQLKTKHPEHFQHYPPGISACTQSVSHVITGESKGCCCSFFSSWVSWWCGEQACVKETQHTCTHSWVSRSEILLPLRLSPRPFTIWESGGSIISLSSENCYANTKSFHPKSDRMDRDQKLPVPILRVRCSTQYISFNYLVGSSLGY